MKGLFIGLVLIAVSIGMYQYFKRYDQVVDQLRQQCEQENWESCHKVGEMRLKVRDYDDSVPVLRKACSQKYLMSCHLLGSHFIKFRMFKKAREILVPNCEQGDQKSCELVELAKSKRSKK